MPGNQPPLSDRIAGALWGMLIADALASPSHWFYGGKRQVQQLLGGPIKGYVAPLSGRGAFPPSIMALSDTAGAGRRGGGSTGRENQIVGDVINHGKRKYWQKGSGYHYHCTLGRGENTLEGSIARLAIRTLSSQPTHSPHFFDFDRLQAEYVKFMTTPGSHNDAYASSYHRLFFQ